MAKFTQGEVWTIKELGELGYKGMFILEKGTVVWTHIKLQKNSRKSYAKIERAEITKDNQLKMHHRHVHPDTKAIVLSNFKTNNDGN